MAQVEQAEWGAAKEDFARAHELCSRDAYAVLLLAMAEMRLESDGWASRLEEQSRNLREDWPMPVIQFYRGDLTLDRLISAVHSPDKSKRSARTCVMDFFVGEWQLGHGQSREAIGSLRKAESRCPHSDICYLGASQELKNLQAVDTAHGRQGKKQ
jgi:lipoprotein NlpI